MHKGCGRTQSKCHNRSSPSSRNTSCLIKHVPRQPSPTTPPSKTNVSTFALQRLSRTSNAQSFPDICPSRCQWTSSTELDRGPRQSETERHYSEAYGCSKGLAKLQNLSPKLLRTNSQSSQCLESQANAVKDVAAPACFRRQSFYFSCGIHQELIAGIVKIARGC